MSTLTLTTWGRDLEVYAAFLAPRTLRWWRTEAAGWVRAAAAALERVRRIEALLIRHEPAADAWLRQQLGALHDPTGGPEP